MHRNCSGQLFRSGQCYRKDIILVPLYCQTSSSNKIKMVDFHAIFRSEACRCKASHAATAGPRSCWFLCALVLCIGQWSAKKLLTFLYPSAWYACELQNLAYFRTVAATSRWWHLPWHLRSLTLAPSVDLLVRPTICYAIRSCFSHMSTPDKQQS